MGYQTTFSGHFDIAPALTPEDREFLLKLSNSRRMARKVGPEFGMEGEFYVADEGIEERDFENPNIIDEDRPPSTQPSLWCHWAPNASGTALQWNGREKFYEYVAWIEYLVEAILEPRGFTLNGTCLLYTSDAADE